MFGLCLKFHVGAMASPAPALVSAGGAQLSSAQLSSAQLSSAQLSSAQLCSLSLWGFLHPGWEPVPGAETLPDPPAAVPVSGTALHLLPSLLQCHQCHPPPLPLSPAGPGDRQGLILGTGLGVPFLPPARRSQDAPRAARVAQGLSPVPRVSQRPGRAGSARPTLRDPPRTGGDRPGGGAGDAPGSRSPARVPGAMKVKVISVLEDNYMYLVIEESTRHAVAVDAAVPKRLLEIIRKEDVVLRAILTTHHHWDHARGNEELAQLLPGLQVFGADERIGALTHRVSHGQELSFGTIRVRCLFTPCHTSGHMCYFMWEDDSPDAPALFSGDTLFVGGCGQFFEGTAEQMHTNLTQTLGALPKDTKVFCGHECTVRNLKFALKVEPENEVVKEKLAWAKQRDDEDLPTVPSTLQEEFLYNPFLRVTEEAVQRFTGRTDPVEVLRALRSHRDNFKKPKERPNPQAMLAFDWGLFGPFLEKK